MLTHKCHNSMLLCNSNSFYHTVLREECIDMLEISELDGPVAAVMSFVQKSVVQQPCVYMPYDDTVYLDERPQYDPYRQTMYQQCSQLGGFRTTSAGSLFETTVPLEIFTARCMRIFGSAVWVKNSKCGWYHFFFDNTILIKLRTGQIIESPKKTRTVSMWSTVD